MLCVCYFLPHLYFLYANRRKDEITQSRESTPASQLVGSSAEASFDFIDARSNLKKNFYIRFNSELLICPSSFLFNQKRFQLSDWVPAHSAHFHKSSKFPQEVPAVPNAANP